MNYKTISSFILFLISGIVLYAQPLDELLKMGMQENLQLKALQHEYLAALERVPQVNQLPDSEVGIGGFPLPVETRLGAQIVRLSATQMFPWFGTLEQKVNLETAKAQALHEQIAINALDITFEIKRAYFQLYEIQQSQAIIQRNIEIWEAFERLAITKVESGKATVADVLRIQLKINELKQELDILETTRAQPTLTINQLLHRSLEIPIEINDSLSFAQLLFNRDSVANIIKEGHPALRFFALQQEVARQAIEVNRLDAKPSFGLGLDYIMVNQRSDANPVHNGRDILQVRASVKFPISRQKYQAKEREEMLKITALEDRKTNAFTQFMRFIETAYAEHESARLKLELYDQQITITKAAINILETDYSTTGNSFDELLRLEKELIDYDLKKLKTVVVSHLIVAKIERVLMF